MTRAEAEAALAACGQSQVLDGFDALTAPQQEALLDALAGCDLSLTNAFAHRTEAASRGTITPLPALTLDAIGEKKDAFRKTGLAALKRGECACVLLAGGMGTRLGYDGPKGTLDIGLTHPVYIFERLFASLSANAAGAGFPVRLLIMTSALNDAATRSFLAEKNYFGYPADRVSFFTQDMAPCVGEDGKILMEAPGRMAMSPNGNGGWFSSMTRAGLTDKLEAEGVRFLNVFGVDNVLQQLADPVFLGAVIDAKVPSGAKVIRKVSPDEKVGVMCLADGRPSVIEYYEMTQDLLDARLPDGSYAYSFGVILNYLFEIEALRAHAGDCIPVHFAHKAIPCMNEAGDTVKPDAPNGWKFEYFILDLIHALPGCLPFEVEREKEFAPVKNRTGVDSVESARALLKGQGISL